MKHIVEFFDGKKIRGLLLDEARLSWFISRVERLDPILGAFVLDIIPERRPAKHSARPPWHAAASIDRDRYVRVDQVLS